VLVADRSLGDLLARRGAFAILLSDIHALPPSTNHPPLRAYGVLLTLQGGRKRVPRYLISDKNARRIAPSQQRQITPTPKTPPRRHGRVARAYQIFERYVALAREAAISSDPGFIFARRALTTSSIGYRRLHRTDAVGPIAFQRALSASLRRILRPTV
jgi:hypothetical protein